MKVKNKKVELGTLSAPLAATVVQPVICLVVKGITVRGVMRAGREYYDSMDKNL